MLYEYNTEYTTKQFATCSDEDLKVAEGKPG